MVNRKKSDTGVTLITLVITIAVLLILAGITIAEVFKNNELLDRSSEFAESTNNAIEESTEQVDNMINQIDEIMTPWVQDKTVVSKKTKNGTIKKQVGDVYEYDCGVDGYTGVWKILGAENGKLLIMSTVDVGTLTLSGKDGYNTGISKLNEMCAPYGRNARSITVEDINRVTGYDPTNQGDGTVYCAGEFWEYGNKVTYTASGSSATNEKTYTGSISYEHPDGRKIGTDNVTSITVENTCYYYYPYSLTTSSSTTGECKGIATDSPAYKLLFRKADDSANCSFWLASSFVYAYSSNSGFGLRRVYSDGSVNGCYLWYSYGGTYSSTLGGRAVVAIDS